METPWIRLRISRQDDLVVWNRPKDRFFTVCCYRELARLIGDMHSDGTRDVEIKIRDAAETYPPKDW